MIESSFTSLQALVAIHEHGTLTAAARALGYSTSGLSAHIRKLEQGLEVEILRKRGRRVELTPAGHVALHEARTLMTEATRAATRIREAGGVIPTTVRILAGTDAMRGLVLPTIRRLRDELPGLRVEVGEADAPTALACIRAGTAQLAVLPSCGRSLPDTPQGLASRPVAGDVVDVLLSSEHRHGDRPHLEAKDLLHETWVTDAPSGQITGWISQLFAGQSTSPAFAHHVSDETTRILLTALPGPVTLLARMGRPHLPPTVRAVPLVNPPLTRTFHALWPESLSANENLQELLSHIAEQGLRLSPKLPRLPGSTP